MMSCDTGHVFMATIHGKSCVVDAIHALAKCRNTVGCDSSDQTMMRALFTQPGQLPLIAAAQLGELI